MKFQIEADEDKLVLPWYLIRNQSTNKFIWNVLVFFTVVWTTTMVPFRIAFYADEEELTWTVTDIISDVIFVVDIVITFFVIEEGSDGTPIVTLKGIAKKYLKGYFVFDLISSIPVSTIIYVYFSYKTQDRNSNFQFVNLIKTLRIYRVVVIMKILRIIR